MADETQAVDNSETTEQAQAQPQQETDWKAEAEKWKSRSREWEKKSKENKSAADELEQLKAAQMTEQQKAEARAEKAEAELARLVAESERHEAAKRIAEQSGVPLQLIEFCADEDAMRSFADEYAKQLGNVHAVASATGSRIVRGNEAKRTNADVFAEIAAQQLGI